MYYIPLKHGQNYKPVPSLKSGGGGAQTSHSISTLEAEKLHERVGPVRKLYCSNNCYLSGQLTPLLLFCFYYCGLFVFLCNMSLIWGQQLNFFLFHSLPKKKAWYFGVSIYFRVYCLLFYIDSAIIFDQNVFFPSSLLLNKACFYFEEGYFGVKSLLCRLCCQSTL